MKRDMDLIRDILRQVEAAPFGKDAVTLDFPDGDPAEVSYHVMLLHQAGLIDAYNNHRDPLTYGETGSRDRLRPLRKMPDWKPLWLTSDGHDFLAAASNPGIWDGVKNRLKKEAIDVPLAVFLTMLKAKAAEKLGLS